MSDSSQMGAQGVPPALPLAVNLQYTKDLSFEVPSGPEIFTALQAAPQISVNIDVQANRLQNDQSVFEVALTIKTEANEAPTSEGGPAGRKVFIAELTYAAVVTLNNAPAELVEPLLLVEVPRLIFPYARNILGDVTRDGGFPPVVLQPIDFVALWQARRSEFAQAEAVGHA
ncbi:protein-export chaperone SecB [Acetobacter oeni]|uniref:Protein-export protein SecB n=1 Tax=Acetobacter oeni TaxID=304077 RepID=A0A511XK21_9PROT|nr:protein-export chaperone SecB [Acetobacter oeni]MBB3883098.1 preprotein translocase subunit SecB [Acetobacter oeni]NHO19260.1 protein-export chaperone SecB [Acetobacter oeni]GBR07096.1 preprotein translocase subunit SecB [Acetobacter oeni LMG 21952]GEN63279.1 protein-export protein SecB [Acetobacter oeni]